MVKSKPKSRMQRGACERARGDNRVGELDEELARQADPGDANRIGHSIGLQARISTAHKDMLYSHQAYD